MLPAAKSEPTKPAKTDKQSDTHIRTTTTLLFSFIILDAILLHRECNTYYRAGIFWNFFFATEQGESSLILGEDKRGLGNHRRLNYLLMIQGSIFGHLHCEGGADGRMER